MTMLRDVIQIMIVSNTRVFGESDSEGLAKGIGWRPEQSERHTTVQLPPDSIL